MHVWIRLDVLAVELALTFLVLFWIRRSQKRRDRFPWSFLGELLLWGAITALLSAFIEIRFSLQPADFSSNRVIISSINSFAPALIEELAKYMIGVFVVLSTRHAHKLSDTVLYFILIGLGFSLLEDIFFLMNPATFAPYRLLSFYVHSGTGAMVGYAFARFKFGLSGYSGLIGTLILAILLHGLYNYAVQPENVSWAYPLAVILILGISIQVFILYQQARRLERHELMRSSRLRQTVRQLLRNY